MPITIKPTSAETVTIQRLSEILSRVEKDDNGCWRYTGRLSQNGYARFSVNNREVFGHRVTYAIAYKEPVQMLDHICEVKSCINPKHLREVTSRENSLYSKKTLAYSNLVKSHCPSGHPYSGDNVYIRPGKGHRTCKTCHREWIAKKRSQVK